MGATRVWRAESKVFDPSGYRTVSTTAYTQGRHQKADVRVRARTQGSRFVFRLYCATRWRRARSQCCISAVCSLLSTRPG